MASDRETRAHVAGKWLLALVVPGSALAIGSLHTTTLIVVSLLAAVSCVLLWLDPPKRTSRASRWVLIAFAILLGATILQAIPLPAGLVSVIAPANADVWARALTPLHEPGPSWHPLSVAPPATQLEILRGILYGCTFLAALRVSFSEGGSTFLEIVVVASASVLAVSTLAHTATQAERVFGVYRPRDVQGYVAYRIGPLLNPNHVAAYCNVGALVAAGVALDDRRTTARILAIGAVVLLAGTSVWAASRGGTGSLLAGAVILAGMVAHRRRRRRTIGQAEIGVMLAALLAAGMLVGLSVSDVARADLAGRDLGKLNIFKMAMRLVSLSPFFGIGRGSFETMFPVVRQGTAYFTFLRPENIVAQWTTEWGVLVAIGGFGALAAALRPRIVLRAERPAIGAWVAVLVAALHDLVDFHLEVPGVTVLVVICVATVVGPRSWGTERRSSAPSARPARALAFASAAAAVVAALVVIPHVGHSLPEDRDAVARIAVDASMPRDAFRAELRRMMLQYPAEAFFPLAGAIRAQAVGDGSIVPWVARALERYPGFGRAHLVLARSMVQRHRAQARLEYRLAFENDENLRHMVVREAPLVVDDRDSALELVPDGNGGLEMLESLAASLVNRLPATSQQLDEELARRDPTAPGPLRRRVRAALSDLTHEHLWCGTCAADGISAAQALVARDPDKCEPRVLLARVRVAAGRREQALDDLERGVEKTADRGVCLRELVSLCLETGDRRRADAVLDLAMRSGCGTREECVDLYAWAASIDESRGNLVRALSFYKRLADLTPENDANLRHVAELSERAGLVGEAIDAYGKLAMRHPEDSQWRLRADTLRAKAHENRVRARP